MKIGNYYLEHNERMPMWVLWYLEERYEALENYLFTKYENVEVDIGLDVSRQSESMYIHIQPYEGQFNETTIRIANHDVFSTESRSDIYYTMTDYRYWKDLKKELLNKIDEIVKENVE